MVVARTNILSDQRTLIHFQAAYLDHHYYNGWLLTFYIFGTSNVISGWVRLLAVHIHDLRKRLYWGFSTTTSHHAYFISLLSFSTHHSYQCCAYFYVIVHLFCFNFVECLVPFEFRAGRIVHHR